MLKDNLIAQLKILGFKEHNMEHYGYYLSYGKNPIIFRLSVNKNYYPNKTLYRLTHYNKKYLVTYDPTKVKDTIISYFNQTNSYKYNSQEQEVG